MGGRKRKYDKSKMDDLAGLMDPLGNYGKRRSGDIMADLGHFAGAGLSSFPGGVPDLSGLPFAMQGGMDFTGIGSLPGMGAGIPAMPAMGVGGVSAGLPGTAGLTSSSAMHLGGMPTAGFAMGGSAPYGSTSWASGGGAGLVDPVTSTGLAGMPLPPGSAGVLPGTGPMSSLTDPATLTTSAGMSAALTPLPGMGGATPGGGGADGAGTTATSTGTSTVAGATAAAPATGGSTPAGDGKGATAPGNFINILAEAASMPALSPRDAAADKPATDTAPAAATGEGGEGGEGGGGGGDPAPAPAPGQGPAAPEGQDFRCADEREAPTHTIAGTATGGHLGGTPTQGNTTAKGGESAPAPAPAPHLPPFPDLLRGGGGGPGGGEGGVHPVQVWAGGGDTVSAPPALALASARVAGVVQHAPPPASVGGKPGAEDEPSGITMPGWAAAVHMPLAEDAAAARRAVAACAVPCFRMTFAHEVKGGGGGDGPTTTTSADAVLAWVRGAVPTATYANLEAAEMLGLGAEDFAAGGGGGPFAPTTFMHPASVRGHLAQTAALQAAMVGVCAVGAAAPPPTAFPTGLRPLVGGQGSAQSALGFARAPSRVWAANGPMVALRAGRLGQGPGATFTALHCATHVGVDWWLPAGWRGGGGMPGGGGVTLDTVANHWPRLRAITCYIVQHAPGGVPRPLAPPAPPTKGRAYSLDTGSSANGTVSPAPSSTHGEGWLAPGTSDALLLPPALEPATAVPQDVADATAAGVEEEEGGDVVPGAAVAAAGEALLTSMLLAQPHAFRHGWPASPAALASALTAYLKAQVVLTRAAAEAVLGWH